MPCAHPLEKRVQLEKFRIRFYPETLLRTISWEGKSSDSSEQSQRGKGRTRIYTSFCRKKKNVVKYQVITTIHKKQTPC